MSDAPLILTFDTSAAHCAAALFRGSDEVAARMEPMARGQAERLMPLLEDVLAEGGVRWRDLAALAVLTGPGNFTGIRISVAAARGLAMALGVPAIGVTAFEGLGVGLPENGLIVLDNRRNGYAWWRCGEVGTGDRDALCAAAAGASMIRGHEAEALGRELGLPWDGPRVPELSAVADVARGRLGSDVPPAAPFYLRPADAALPSDPPPPILP
ncbi:MAG: tRNA (adenosine(37)-N6)-threonylcarbamoyltransferase complex dimerization subunit type 1 TsaB [Pseudomonadota bacterium]